MLLLLKKKTFFVFVSWNVFRNNLPWWCCNTTTMVLHILSVLPSCSADKIIQNGTVDTEKCRRDANAKKIKISIITSSKCRISCHFRQCCYMPMTKWSNFLKALCKKRVLFSMWLNRSSDVPRHVPGKDNVSNQHGCPFVSGPLLPSVCCDS